MIRTKVPSCNLRNDDSVKSKMTNWMTVMTKRNTEAPPLIPVLPQVRIIKQVVVSTPLMVGGRKKRFGFSLTRAKENKQDKRKELYLIKTMDSQDNSRKFKSKE